MTGVEMKKELMVLFGAIISALVFAWLGGETIHTNEIFSGFCIVLAGMSSIISFFSAVSALVG
jgi:hypothetical protein